MHGKQSIFIFLALFAERCLNIYRSCFSIADRFHKLGVRKCHKKACLFVVEVLENGFASWMLSFSSFHHECANWINAREPNIRVECSTSLFVIKTNFEDFWMSKFVRNLVLLFENFFIQSKFEMRQKHSFKFICILKSRKHFFSLITFYINNLDTFQVNRNKKLFAGMHQRNCCQGIPFCHH